MIYSKFKLDVLEGLLFHWKFEMVAFEEVSGEEEET